MLNRILLIFLTLAFAVSVSAQPLTWWTQGGTFDDGGTFSGSFNYYADNDTYSNIKHHHDHRVVFRRGTVHVPRVRRRFCASADLNGSAYYKR